MTGSDVGQIPEDSFGGSRWIGETMGELHPVLNPENTKAVTTEEKIARGVGQGAGYALAPEAALAAMARTGAIAPRAVETAGKLFGRGESVGATTANAVIGGTSGGGSVAAQESAPDEYKPLAGMLGGIGSGNDCGIGCGYPERRSNGRVDGRRLISPLCRRRVGRGLRRSGFAVKRQTSTPCVKPSTTCHRKSSLAQCRPRAS